MSNNQRVGFATKMGVIAATVGAAVGLGNIWRFPYTVGTNGGGAFLIVYLICILAVGLPVMLAELYMGRTTGQNPRGAFKSLTTSRYWPIVGWLCILSPLLIMGFYSVVAGWTAEYFIQAVTGGLEGRSTAELNEIFANFSSSTVKPIFWLFIFLGLTAMVSLGGIKNGIERVSNVLMPLLFVLLLIMGGRSLMLEGALEGMTFLFKPDFSKIDMKVILEALGQAFFSLSIGLGISITYGSYFKKDTNIPRTALIVSMLDTLVAILAGIIIFPAVFTFGIAPGQGPELVFITLPNVFNQMIGGQIWASLFFLLLAIAALTSTISLAEVVITFAIEEFKISRKKAVAFLVLASGVLGIFSSLSLGNEYDLHFFGRSFFDLLDYTTSNLILPIAGCLIAVFIGWRVPSSKFYDELRMGSNISRASFNVFHLALKYLAPVAILLILLFQLGIIK
ncbi:MAG: sodium-dependent transporter [Bacteroidales bacterium]